MKINQPKAEFQPITITLETREEAAELYNAIKDRISGNKTCLEIFDGLTNMDVIIPQKPVMAVSKEPVEKPFPKLMKYKSPAGSYIVAMIGADPNGSGVGVVIESNHRDWASGDMYKDFDLSLFEDCKLLSEFPKIVKYNSLVVCATKLSEAYGSFEGYLIAGKSGFTEIGEYVANWSRADFGL